MGTTKLKAVTVYLTDEEYKQLKEDCEHEASISNWIRHHLKLPLLRPGAPDGNKNRTIKQTKGKKIKQ